MGRISGLSPELRSGVQSSAVAQHPSVAHLYLCKSMSARSIAVVRIPGIAGESGKETPLVTSMNAAAVGGPTLKAAANGVLPTFPLGRKLPNA